MQTVYGDISNPSIAVCLTSFNGVPWLSEQIDSIHSQSGVALTVFISVDVSSDGTEKWIDQKGM